MARRDGLKARLYRGLAVLAVATLLAAGCGGGDEQQPSAGSNEPYKLHMRVTPSNAAWVVAQEEGLFDRIDLDYELVGYGESTALFLAGQDPVGQESAWEAARFQSEGEDISYFGTAGSLNFYSGLIIRSADADKYKSLADLKGARLGQPGFGTGTWQAFEIIAKSIYNMNARTDFQPVEADPGALLGLLEKGEIDATINFTGQTVTSLTRPDFKVLLNFSKEWQRTHGQPLMINGFLARRDWLEENTDVARRLVDGVDKGLQWIKDHPEAFAKGGKYAHIVEGEGWYATPETTEQVLELLQGGEWYFPANQFNNAFVDSTYEFIQQGKGVFADEIPPKEEVFFMPLVRG
jgi:ABC-type nitrate/sulfonate/bicarbonate transport system substrate-binding protein